MNRFIFPIVVFVLGTLAIAQIRAASAKDAHIANSKFVSMEGVGHALFVDDPVKFNDLLEQFLDGLKTPGRHEKKASLN